ncbi:MAG: DUF2064 domain-containing protein [Chthoniobacterales bacterium]
MNLTTLPTAMPTRAVLIFADSARLDLSRRRLPTAALALFRSPELASSDFGDADVHVFGSASCRVRDGQQFHPQCGGSFAQRFESAIETLASLGYSEVVAVGRDCPALVAADIGQAFAELRDHRLVLGPDHRGGCYLIALHTSDRGLLRGVRWNHNTDCAQLCDRSGPSTVFLLPVKHDIDSWADLKFAAQVNERVARLAAFLLQTIGVSLIERPPIFHAAAQFVRLHGQIPPPASAG